MFEDRGTDLFQLIVSCLLEIEESTLFIRFLNTLYFNISDSIYLVFNSSIYIHICLHMFSLYTIKEFLVAWLKKRLAVKWGY